MSILDLPDRPLVVKCTFDKGSKKINFNSARNCSYQILKERVEKCFSLRSSNITWKDDDGEEIEILSDPALVEAVQYYSSGGDEGAMSSAASILSGRSFGQKKITLRVLVTVDYDGRLSDTSSLAPLEEFTSNNRHDDGFSFSEMSSELDDDAVTVSSRDHLSASSSHSGRIPSRNGYPSNSPTVPYKVKPKSDGLSDWDLSLSGHSSSGIYVSSQEATPHRGGPPSRAQEPSQRSDSYHSDPVASASYRYPADPGAVFARLKLQEELGREDHSDWDAGGEDRGARWLREQKERVIRSKLGALPAPSEVESGSGGSFDDLTGDLYLERNNSGKYYYTYNASASGSSQAPDDAPQSTLENDEEFSVNGAGLTKPRPSSRHLNWLAEQQIETEEHRKLQSSASHSSLPKLVEPTTSTPYLDQNLLYAHLTAPPAEILTDCSICGIALDSLRYVCSICGEKPPIGSQHHAHSHDLRSKYTYPPQPHSTSPHSPQTLYVGSNETVFAARSRLSPPTSSGSGSAFSSTTQVNLPNPGYELCAGCFEAGGIHHAIEAGLSSSSSSTFSSAPMDLSSWRRTAPKKGNLRHAFKEKIWGDFGWEDIAQDESVVARCTTCNATTGFDRYKCSACPNFQLCRACYSLVHDIHPNDAFILVPDAPPQSTATPSNPDPDFSNASLDVSEDEQSLEHHGVTCAHCLLPIVGARFHCAICSNVDICSNCEGAGLPGNMEGSSHNSSHILIKVIRGVRYQCGHCPSTPNAYNLCSDCEGNSWAIHDPWHIFFKIPRTINTQYLESPNAFLPPLYLRPAGPAVPTRSDSEDPRAYLRGLSHTVAVCDKCMQHIEGEWFRCANCPLDLCYHCERVNTHAPDHIFIVIKSTIDLAAFRSLTSIEFNRPILDRATSSSPNVPNYC
ncbi:hypothetical protein BKA70DRAFT_1368348 [Coprinopsis sp. MPI-PUGE-AT-0042]|nr:hypothetical protein BKA70DRAFT_1368348 [Coprinopsis sp. MPI-PUGE-AT-0042]